MPHVRLLCWMLCFLSQTRRRGWPLAVMFAGSPAYLTSAPHLYPAALGLGMPWAFPCLNVPSRLDWINLKAFSGFFWVCKENNKPWCWSRALLTKAFSPDTLCMFHWGLLYFFDMCKISENEKLSELGSEVKVHLNLNSFSVLCASHEFEQTLGDSDGPGSQTCCSPWGCKESDMT